VVARHVPRALWERQKAGFAIPLAAWLRGPLRDWADDLLSPASIGHQNLLRAAPIVRAWEEHRSGKQDWSHRLWSVLMLQAWLQARS